MNGNASIEKFEDVLPLHVGGFSTLVRSSTPASNEEHRAQASVASVPLKPSKSGIQVKQLQKVASEALSHFSDLLSSAVLLT